MLLLRAGVRRPDRSPDLDRTVERELDVQRAFREADPPTSPTVHAMVPLDAIPALAVPRSTLPWNELGRLATQLLLRIDGSRTAMSVVRLESGTPAEAARELARLAATGVVRLVAPRAPADAGPLELDLSLV